MLIIINKPIKLDFFFKLNIFYLFNIKKYFLKIINFRLIKISIIDFFFNNFFLLYKKFCTFKYPLLLLFSDNFFFTMGLLFIKKFKNYLKFSLLHITRILNFQWDMIYKRNINNYCSNFLILTKNISISFSLYVLLKISNIILFNFSIKYGFNVFNNKNIKINSSSTFSVAAVSNKKINLFFNTFYKNSYKFFSYKYISKNKYLFNKKLKIFIKKKKISKLFNHRRFYCNNYIKYKFKNSFILIKNNIIKYKLSNINIKIKKNSKIVKSSYKIKKNSKIVKLKMLFLKLRKKQNIFLKLTKLYKKQFSVKKKFLNNDVNFFRFNSNLIKTTDTFQPLVYNKKMIKLLSKINLKNFNSSNHLFTLDFLFKNTSIISFIKLNINKFYLVNGFLKVKDFIKNNNYIKYFKKEESCKMNIQNYFVRPSTYYLHGLLKNNKPYSKNLLFEKKKLELKLKQDTILKKLLMEEEENKKSNESLDINDKNIDSVKKDENADSALDNTSDLLKVNNTSIDLKHKVILDGKEHTISFDNSNRTNSEILRLQRYLDNQIVPTANIFFNVYNKIYDRGFNIYSFNMLQFKFKFLKKNKKFKFFFRKQYRKSVLYELRDFFKPYILIRKMPTIDFLSLKKEKRTRYLFFIKNLLIISKISKNSKLFYKKNNSLISLLSEISLVQDYDIDLDLENNILINNFITLTFDDNFFSEINFLSFKKLNFNIFYIKKYSFSSYFRNKVFMNFIVILNTLKYFHDWKYKINSSNILINNRILKYLLSINSIKNLRGRDLLKYGYIPNLKLNKYLLSNNLRDFKKKNLHVLENKNLSLYYYKEELFGNNQSRGNYLFYFFNKVMSYRNSVYQQFINSRSPFLYNFNENTYKIHTTSLKKNISFNNNIYRFFKLEYGIDNFIFNKNYAILMFRFLNKNSKYEGMGLSALLKKEIKFFGNKYVIKKSKKYSYKWNFYNEFYKNFLYKNNFIGEYKYSVINVYYRDLIKKLPIFLNPYSLYKTPIIFKLNPFLFSIYKNQDPLTCYIPDNLTIFNIFTDYNLIKKYIKYDPIFLFKNILIKVGDFNYNIDKIRNILNYEKKYGVLDLRGLMTLYKNQKSILSISNYLLLSNIIINHDLFLFILNKNSYVNFNLNTNSNFNKLDYNLNFLDNFLKFMKIKSLDLFLDNNSKIYFKSVSTSYLINIICFNKLFFFKNSIDVYNNKKVIYLRNLYNKILFSNFNNNFIIKNKIISFFDINSKYFDISYNKIFKYFFINNNLNSLKYNIRDSFIKYKYLNNFNKNNKQVLLKKKLLDNNLKLNKEKKNKTDVFYKLYNFCSLFNKENTVLNIENVENSILKKKNILIFKKKKYNKKNFKNFKNIDPFIINLNNMNLDDAYFFNLFEKIILTKSFFSNIKNVLLGFSRNSYFNFNSFSDSCKKRITGLVFLYIILLIKKNYISNKKLKFYKLNNIIGLFFSDKKKNKKYLMKIFGKKNIKIIDFIFSSYFFLSFHSQIINSISFKLLKKNYKILNNFLNNKYFTKFNVRYYNSSINFIFNILNISIYNYNFSIMKKNKKLNFSIMKKNKKLKLEKKSNLIFNFNFNFFYLKIILNYIFNLFNYIKYFKIFNKINFLTFNINFIKNFFFNIYNINNIFHKDNYNPFFKIFTHLPAIYIKNFFNYLDYKKSVLKSWNFSIVFLVKIGFLNFISKTSTFLNSLHFFTLKHRYNTFFNKFWNDRGFFFPIEIPAYKFFFLYYSNFFFNFFETSTYLNFNSFYNRIQQQRKLKLNKIFYKDSPLTKKKKINFFNKVLPVKCVKKFNLNKIQNFSNPFFFKKNINTFYFSNYSKASILDKIFKKKLYKKFKTIYKVFKFNYNRNEILNSKKLFKRYELLNIRFKFKKKFKFRSRLRWILRNKYLNKYKLKLKEFKLNFFLLNSYSNTYKLFRNRLIYSSIKFKYLNFFKKFLKKKIKNKKKIVKRIKLSRSWLLDPSIKLLKKNIFYYFFRSKKEIHPYNKRKKIGFYYPFSIKYRYRRKKYLMLRSLKKIYLKNFLKKKLKKYSKYYYLNNKSLKVIRLKLKTIRYNFKNRKNRYYVKTNNNEFDFLFSKEHSNLNLNIDAQDEGIRENYSNLFDESNYNNINDNLFIKKNNYISSNLNEDSKDGDDKNMVFLSNSLDERFLFKLKNFNFNTSTSFISHYNNYIKEDSIGYSDNLILDLFKKRNSSNLLNNNYIEFEEFKEDRGLKSSLFLESNSVSKYQRIKSIHKKRIYLKKNKEEQRIIDDSNLVNNVNIDDSNYTSSDWEHEDTEDDNYEKKIKNLRTLFIKPKVNNTTDNSISKDSKDSSISNGNEISKEDQSKENIDNSNSQDGLKNNDTEIILKEDVDLLDNVLEKKKTYESSDNVDSIYINNTKFIDTYKFIPKNFIQDFTDKGFLGSDKSIRYINSVLKNKNIFNFNNLSQYLIFYKKKRSRGEYLKLTRKFIRSQKKKRLKTRSKKPISIDFLRKKQIRSWYLKYLKINKSYYSQIFSFNSSIMFKTKVRSTGNLFFNYKKKLLLRSGLYQDISRKVYINYKKYANFRKKKYKKLISFNRYLLSSNVNRLLFNNKSLFVKKYNNLLQFNFYKNIKFKSFNFFKKKKLKFKYFKSHLRYLFRFNTRRMKLDKSEWDSFRKLNYKNKYRFLVILKGRNKKLSLVKKKTLQFYSVKSSYSSFSSYIHGHTNFFNIDNSDIDSSNLFNHSRLYSSLGFKSNNKNNIQSFFLKNKISSQSFDYNFDNYFFNITYLKRKERIARTNYITRKSNIIFKLKPGYRVYWRSYRKSFRSIAYLTYYRQRRLTNYFLNFKKANSLLLLRNFEFSIFSIVKRSCFFLDYTVTLLCFRLGMVYLNGKKAVDQGIQVYVGDRVQISISFSYLLQFKWFFFFLNNRRVRFLNKYIKHFFNIKNNNLALRKVLLDTSNKLFKKFLYYCKDVPNYLEVDYFLLLSTIIYEPFLFYEFDPILIYRIPYLSMRVYNWKYVN